MNAKTKWTVGSATGTLYKDGVPTGTEIDVLNTNGGTIDELIEQAHELEFVVEQLRIAKEMIKWDVAEETDQMKRINYAIDHAEGRV